MTASIRQLVVAGAAYATLGALAASRQAMPIGIIDFYGLRSVSADRARAALTFKEGDTIAPAGDERPRFLVESEARLAALPGVSRARIEPVCCDDGRVIVYVGIEERGAAPLRFRAAPEGDARLAADVIKAGQEYSTALTLAVERGNTAEDRARGHALSNDPAMRAIQDRFVAYADRDLVNLRQVLRRSSNADERALAAQVLAYAADKQAVVDDLIYGVDDPSENVRNSAIRALMVMAEMTPRAGTPPPRIPPEPFIALLGSLAWSDRNKASGALAALTRSRDPGLLDTLRRQALSPLVEMARWKSQGHALLPFLVLARLAGYSEDAAFALWQRGERETVINAAMARK